MTYTSQIKTQFSGISQPAPPTFVDPPHNALGVGPNNIVMVNGSSVEWTNLTGGSGTTTSVYTFFNSLGATADNALFDPRAVFDSASGRFIVTMNNLGPGQTSSTVDIAVSKDSNPNDGWSFAALNTTATISGQPTLSDQPILAVDGTNIYVTTPQFNVTGGAFAGTEQWVISDAAGNGTASYPLTLKASPVAPTSEGVMRVAAGSNGTTYYAGATNNGGQTVVTLQTYNVGSGTFSFPTSIPLGNSDQGSGASNYTAQQKGTNVLLDAGDGKIQNLAYANGFLYGVSEVTPVGSSAPEIHWFKIDVSNPNSPTLAAQGDISGASIGAGVALFDASIAVDAANDVVINFTASGANMFPGDYYVFHGGADPATSFSAPVSYQASNTFLANGDGPTVQRWGINSSAIADPNNSGSFWLSSEYVSNSFWQTAVAEVQVKAGPTVTAGATATFTGGGAPVALDSTVTLSDPSSTTIASATVSIGSGFLNGDSLLFTNQHGISGSYDAVHGVLTLTGSSSVANYQTALDSIAYSFSPANGDPTGGGTHTTRSIGWTVSDGASSSTTATSTLNTTTGTVAVPTASALVQTSNGALDYLQFAGANLVASDMTSFSSWRVGAEGDFNHDGHTELVTQDPSSGRIDLLSVSKGILQNSLLEQGSYWNVVGAGDFDGSGRTGIATQNSATGQIDLLWFAGTQLTSSELLNGSYQHVAGVADFNGDGKADFVTQNPNGGQLDFLFFTNAQLTASALTPDSYWPVHDVMNSGGPGQSLMVSQNQASGQLDYLHFNGTTISSTMLEANAFPGLAAVPGMDAAAQFFKGVG